MTATEELRALLDERGVEHKEFVMGINGSDVVTKFDVGQLECAFSEIDKRTVMFRVWNITPAQAVEATLGRGECRPVISDNLTESEGAGDAWADCSVCGQLLAVLTDKNGKIPNYCPNCGRRVTETH